MSNPLLDLSSKDELISNLLSGNKSSNIPNDSPAGERKTFRVQSDLLARLEDFLPKIKEANVQLDRKLQEDPKSVDIEDVDEESGEQYIEMDLGLGVFDLKKDVKEEDIIIDPSTIRAETPAVKPVIVMMDTDKDSEDAGPSDDEFDMVGLEKEQQILAKKSAGDEDINMSS
ncbi:hypothetical protein BC939DRAFT_442971 [Gamsiella multidivaricata]|uniref:uncharacterized protein n=1 Tax=Gamsiella multidivaricata TaxID=101098 RepID=UPI00221FB790|nr:uncharacterized protein BC939DRAFT_442971 [Gamsiella multidivaricata]KAG0364367.1 hypothetical protein BGZ54_007597 [Gamsiella multidivaricata]KAI7828808.1 hypothetical protein BC939DRAFT_442971 [Gamsiella multidivaricata]